MSLLSISLSKGFVPKVSANDNVLKGQVIASKSNVGEDEIINLSKLLGVSPLKIGKYLLKNPGDKILKNEIIAAKKGLIGTGRKRVVSPVTGTLFKVEENSGEIFIRVLKEEGRDIFSPVDGRVTLCDNEQITIDTDKPAILVKNAAGKEGVSGEILFIDEEVVDFNKITGAVHGKILLGRIFPKASLSKAIGLGALGIISVSLRQEDLENLIRKDVKTPICTISEIDFETLAKHKGKIFLNPEKKLIVYT